ncbi:hypothetical protein TRICI_003024 [Trichomonascus ciferrii]|uniref:Major facilitator superfamily (MFS) profile domain-containing protein n=1 Tax=Trichomonascus ciferrii TaxID=44093 RepID=A0A642V694_9ASCO|nr:hypothetical protein TRICI_003024 [Trichomonascus ciferrii]
MGQHKMAGKDVEKGVIVEEVAPRPADNDYVLKRHGTLDLDPMPTNSPKDPLNWSEWKKSYHLLLIGFGAMSCTFIAGGIIACFEPLAAEYNTSIPQASYFTSVQILLLGTGTFIFFPLMNKFGRRPVLSICILMTGVCNLAAGFCKSYGQQMATRVLCAIFLSPYTCVGGVVVAELYFASQRGSRNGVWALMLTLGPSLGPFVMGFVENNVGLHWVFWVFTIMNFVNFGCWLFADETLYLRGEDWGKETKILGFITKTPYDISFWTFVRPLQRVADYRVLVTSITYGLVFGFGYIAPTVEMPQVYVQLFGFNAQEMGIQFVAVIIGSLIGELLSGFLSDKWMQYCIKRRGGIKVIEDRLWVAYPGYVLSIIGLIIWGVTLQDAKPMQWIVTPSVGVAFCAAGLQIVTSPSITYTVDTDYSRAVESGLVVSLIRQIICFIGPFFFPDMFENLSLAGGTGLLAGIIFIAGLVPTIAIHLIGLRKVSK